MEQKHDRWNSMKEISRYCGSNGDILIVLIIEKIRQTYIIGRFCSCMFCRKNAWIKAAGAVKGEGFDR